MSRLVLTVFFLIFTNLAQVECYSAKGFMELEKHLEIKLIKYVNSFLSWLEKLNDRHLRNSELGKLIRYNEIKVKFSDVGEDRGLKKLSMSLLPIIFHIGAASTWGLLTTILAAKSVVIGLILLVFKIAVSSAKVASFFTAWKVKNHKQHDYSWPHQYIYPSDAFNYKPQWSSSEYKTVPISPELEYTDAKSINK